MIKRLHTHLPKILVLGDQAVVSASAFLTNIIVARALGITSYGQFSAIVLVQLFLLSLQQAGSSGIYQVMLARFDAATQQRYTNGLFYLQVGAYGLLTGIAFLLRFLFPSLAGGYEQVFIAAVCGGILYLLQDFLRKVLLTQRKEARALGVDIITNLLQLSLLVYMAWNARLDLLMACWIICLTFLPSVLAGIIWINPGKFSLENIRFALTQHKKQSGWMLLSALLQWFAGNFFVVAAGWWLGAAALGALRLSQYIFGLLNVLLQAVENYALPAASRIECNGAALVGFIRRILFKSFLVMLPILALVAVFAKQLLLISGGQSYAGYEYVMYGLVANYVIIVSGLPIRIALRVKLLNQHYFIGYLIATCFSLLSARWLIGGWGLVGVLAGLFTTQVLVVGYWLIILNRKKVFSWKLFTSY